MPAARCLIVRRLRLAALLALLLLALTLLYTLLFLSAPSRVTWQRTLQVSIFPVNADHSDAVAHYIAQLSPEVFSDIERFLAQQSQRYAVTLKQPVAVHLQPAVAQLPPAVPKEPSILDSVWWALKMQYWVFKHDFQHQPADIRIFINYYAPGNPHGYQHSLGLQKGMIGLVNGFAGQRYEALNNYVATHELLHTVGAQDKYRPEDGAPIWPDGYAEPVREPLFPQDKAEIMAGRIQVTPANILLPLGLNMAVVGPATAVEIGWLSPQAQQ